jgi:hypothetical protein
MGTVAQDSSSSSNDQEEMSMTFSGEIGIQCATPPVEVGPPAQSE